MKTTIKFFLSAAFMAVSLAGYAQNGRALSFSLDSDKQDLSQLPKMDRDIHILENVLDEMFSGGNGSFFSSRGSKGIHIPNNGVIFNIGGSGLFGNGYFTTYDDLKAITVMGYPSAGTGKSSVDDSEKEEDIDKLNQEKEAKLKELATTFLANYGSLLTELKATDKVQVACEYSMLAKPVSSQRISGQSVYVANTRGESKRRLTASANMKDLQDYAAGKMTESQMMSKIKVSTSDKEDKELLDAKILAGIFDDLFNSTFDHSFNRSGRTTWTYFEDFGIMYNLNITSRGNALFSYSINGNVGVTSSNDNESRKTEEEVQKAIEEAYPEFEKMVKENVIKYGRTLKSLGDNEVLIVNIGFSSLRDSKIPRTLQIIVNKKTIDAYASGQKSLEQVMSEVDVKKLTSSITGNSQGVYNIALPAYVDKLNGIQRTAPTADVKGVATGNN